MTYSLPWIDAARSDARNAANSAASSGRPGRPIGIPPIMSMICRRAVSSSIPLLSAIWRIIPWAPDVSMKPGEIRLTRTPPGADFTGEPLAVGRKCCFGSRIRQRRIMKRQAVAVLDRCDMEDDTGTTLQHARQNRPIEPCRRHQLNIQLVLPIVSSASARTPPLGEPEPPTLFTAMSMPPHCVRISSITSFTPRGRHAHSTRGTDVRLYERVRTLAIRKR